MASKSRDGLYRRGQFWWLRTDPITKRPVSTRCRDLRAARAWRAERERRAADPAHAAASEATLGHWARELVTHKARTVSPATTDIARRKLGHWIRLFGPDLTLASMTPALFDQYVATRRAERAAEPTVAKEVSIATQLLRLAKRAGCYPGDLQALRPLDLRATYTPRTRALTAPEVVRLLAALLPKRAAVVAICVGLGTRLSEAFRLLPSDFDWEHARVFVGGTKTEKSRRHLPILSAYRSLIGSAVPHLPLERWSNYWRGLTEACRRAGIPPCSPNDLRRTHATLLAQAGAEKDAVRRLLGHASGRMLERVYDVPGVEQLRERVERGLPGSDLVQVRYTDGTPVPKPAQLPPTADMTRAQHRPALSDVSAQDNAQVRERASVGDGEGRSGATGTGTEVQQTPPALPVEQIPKPGATAAPACSVRAPPAGVAREQGGLRPATGGTHTPATWALAAAAHRMGVLV
jgi:integrase